MEKEDFYLYLLFLAIIWVIYYVIFYTIFRYTVYWDYSDYQISPSITFNIFVNSFYYWYIPIIIAIIVFIIYSIKK
jgi:hypothetical protein